MASRVDRRGGMMTIRLDEVGDVEVIELPTKLEDLLDQEEEARLRSDLERIAEVRRQAATDGAALRLG